MAEVDKNMTTTTEGNQGADNTNNQQTDANKQQPTVKTDDNKNVKTFTQEEVNRMMAKEKEQGRRSVLKELGVKDATKAKEELTTYKAFLESQKTEEQREKDYAGEILAIQREAQEKEDRAEAKVQAIILGVKTDCVDDVIALVMSRADEGSEFSTLIAEIKTKYPNFFNNPSDEKDDAKKGQHGTGGSIQKVIKEEQQNNSNSLGARLAAQRKGMNKKSTYFTN